MQKEVKGEQEHIILLTWNGKTNLWFDHEMIYSFRTTAQHLLIVIKCLLKYNNMMCAIQMFITEGLLKYFRLQIKSWKQAQQIKDQL